MKGARLTAIAALAVPAAALAHAVVYPRASTPGAYEKYVLRVPNESDMSTTTRVEIRFPPEVRVISFGDVVGWKLDVVTDTARRITGAVWTGALPPERFVEFPFIAVNPRAAARLVWPVYQTYSDGERVGWTGPENGETPASVTVIGATDGGAGRGAGWMPYVAGAALVLAVASLGVSVRRRA